MVRFKRYKMPSWKTVPDRKDIPEAPEAPPETKEDQPSEATAQSLAPKLISGIIPYSKDEVESTS